MGTMFEELKIGLEEAIEIERGKRPDNRRVLSFSEACRYSAEEVKAIRREAFLSQAAFAAFLGVTKKTVEAWECGRNHPTGPACRLMELLKGDPKIVDRFIEPSHS